MAKEEMKRENGARNRKWRNGNHGGAERMAAQRKRVGNRNGIESYMRRSEISVAAASAHESIERENGIKRKK
jgi:hypothetical protein